MRLFERQRRGTWGATVLAILAVVLPSTAAAAEKTSLLALPAGLSATGLVAGPDGNLWFAGTRSTSAGSTDVVGRASPAGALSEYPLPTRASSRGGEITVGRDGNLWFTDPAANAVGRVTPGGEIATFPLPTPGALPGAVVAGPGGAVWFVEEGIDKVGRVDPSGAVIEYPLPRGSGPTGIAEGPDGALWIVAKPSAKVIRMAPSGAVTADYPLPEPGRPHAIVPGPGGDLWLSDEAAPRVWRIGAAGAFDEFRVPGELGTRELALGGDGHLWFSAGNAIGSIAASGETGEPECVDSACQLAVESLAKGPEGGVWFTGEALGRFVAPPLRVQIGRRAARVAAGLATVGLSCHGGTAGEACGGVLRITAKLPRARPGEGRAGTVVLDRHRYRLQPATGRRLPLRLRPRATAVLLRQGKLAVRVSASLDDGKGISRRFVLRPRVPRR